MITYKIYSKKVRLYYLEELKVVYSNLGLSKQKVVTLTRSGKSLKDKEKESSIDELYSLCHNNLRENSVNSLSNIGMYKAQFTGKNSIGLLDASRDKKVTYTVLLYVLSETRNLYNFKIYMNTKKGDHSIYSGRTEGDKTLESKEDLYTKMKKLGFNDNSLENSVTLSSQEVIDSNLQSFDEEEDVICVACHKKVHELDEQITDEDRGGTFHYECSMNDIEEKVKKSRENCIL